MESIPPCVTARGGAGEAGWVIGTGHACKAPGEVVMDGLRQEWGRSGV